MNPANNMNKHQFQCPFKHAYLHGCWCWPGRSCCTAPTRCCSLPRLLQFLLQPLIVLLQPLIVLLQPVYVTLQLQNLGIQLSCLEVSQLFHLTRRNRAMTGEASEITLCRLYSIMHA